jgi:hypothetical protein
VTFTKLGDQYPDFASGLSDAAFRTHTEALVWSNRRGLNLIIPKNDLYRFAETRNVDAAVAELLRAGWWRDTATGYDIGMRFPDWNSRRNVP